MKRQNSLISIGAPIDANPRPRIKPKLRRQNAGINNQIHRPLNRIKPELKWADISTAGAPGPFGGFTRQMLNALQTGANPTNRIGRKVTWTKLLLRYAAHVDSATTPTSGCAMRLMVIYDKQTNGSAPIVTDVLVTDEFNSAMNLDNRDRFLILADVITPVFGLGGPAAVAGVINRKFNLETNFNANNIGSIADITTGSIYLMYAQSNSLSGLNISFNMKSRLRFVDF